MKKIILTTICATGLTVASYGQGLLNWGSITFAAMTAQTNSTLISPLFGGGTTGGGASGVTQGAASLGTGYYFELLYGTANTTGIQIAGASAPSNSFAALFGGTWHDTGLQASNNITSFGRLVPMNANASATVPWDAPVSNNIVLVGWSANLGSSWGVVSNELASGSYLGVLNGQNGFFGVTSTGFLQPNDAPASGATVFNNGNTANGGPIYSLNTPLYALPVPEPATMALAGLGGLSLLLFRRQRK